MISQVIVRCFSIAVFALLHVTFTCALAQDTDVALPAAEPTQQEISTASPARQTLSAAPRSDYLIGPEDVLDVEVFSLPELNRTVRVGNDGTIAVALVGPVKAAGLTTEQLAKELESRWGRQYLENPQVSVFVKDFHGQPVSVIGAVERPGIYQLTGPRSLIEVLSMAGGLAKRSTAPAGRSVYVTRKGGFGGPLAVYGINLVGLDKVEIDLRKLFYSNEDTLNIEIKPLDIISVSKADVVYVTGRGVQKPGGFVLEDRENVTVFQILAMAEGLSANAQKRDARIIRREPNGSRVEIPLNLDKVLRGSSPDPVLQANDILFVPDSTQKAALKRGLEAAIGTVSGALIYRGQL
jgi:polysaccharide export outer membrane protein